MRIRRLVVSSLVLSTALGAQIPAAEFAARRDSLAARIDSGVVIAFGGRTLVQDFGTFFQLPAFHYLTNFDEPDAAYVLIARHKRGESMLFVSPINARTAFYYGRRADSSVTLQRYGMNGRPFASLTAVVDSLAASGLPFYTMGDFEDADFARADSLTRGQLFMKMFASRHPAVAVRNAMPVVDQLRAHKTASELALLQKAADLSSEGHRAAMLTANPSHEYELRAALEYTFTRLGAERLAYGSIVGSGVNGTQLHYMKDTDPVPRHFARARTCRPRSRAGLVRRRHVQGGRRVHDRARDLYQLTCARRTPQHTQEPRVHRQGARRGCPV